MCRPTGVMCCLCCCCWLFTLRKHAPISLSNLHLFFFNISFFIYFNILLICLEILKTNNILMAICCKRTEQKTLRRENKQSKKIQKIRRRKICFSFRRRLHLDGLPEQCVVHLLLLFPTRQKQQIKIVIIKSKPFGYYFNLLQSDFVLHNLPWEWARKCFLCLCIMSCDDGPSMSKSQGSLLPQAVPCENSMPCHDCLVSFYFIFSFVTQIVCLVKQIPCSRFILCRFQCPEICLPFQFQHLIFCAGFSFFFLARRCMLN